MASLNPPSIDNRFCSQATAFQHCGFPTAYLSALKRMRVKGENGEVKWGGGKRGRKKRGGGKGGGRGEGRRLEV